ncbi:MAG: NUDIX hydrolase, partial [Clostridium celatum]|nr:NUDIX hydrolase [Clostridium celatum]
NPVMNEILGLDVLNVNGHIKNNKYISSHLHLSIAYLLEANENDELIINEKETSGVKWIPIDELNIHCNEPYIVKTVYDKFNKKIKELSL